MQNSTAFKAACLSVGLATAWSPLGEPEARADSILQVNLNHDVTTSNVGVAYLGLLLSNSSVVVKPLTPSVSVVPWNPDEITAYVAIGTAIPTDGSNTSVWASFQGPYGGALTSPFDSYFLDVLGGGTESTIAAQLNANTAGAFISGLLSMPDVRQSIGSGASVVEFLDDGVTGGLLAGDVGVTFQNLETSVVPLPSSVFMGGSLLAMLSFGRYGVPWARRRFT